PLAPGLNRDRLLYEAGRRAARPRPWVWPVTAGLFAALSVGLGLRLAATNYQPDVSVVVVPSSPPLAPDAPHAPDAPDGRYGPLLHDELAVQRATGAGYLRLRDQVVRFGADSLPATVSSPTAPPPPIEQMLGLPFGTLTDTQKSRWQHQLS